VLATWVVVTLLLAGIGLATRTGILAVTGLHGNTAVCSADIWTGLGALTGYLLFWSLLAPIGPATWIAPIALSLVGLGLVLRGPTSRPRLTLLSVPLILLIVWLANLSLGGVQSYDSGLYHFAAIEYASHSAAIPGLGNLQDRLSAGNAHFLFVAFLGVRPWSGAGHHVANGLLVSLLVVHLWTILANSSQASRGLMSWRVAVFTVPAIVLVPIMNAGQHLTSPSIDLPAFVLVIAAGISLAQAYERSLDMRYVIGGIAALATGVAIRPQVAPALVAAIGLVLLSAHRRHRQSLVSIAMSALVLPLVLVIGLAARQTILSGYPLFPSGLLAAPVDWRVPPDVLSNYRAWVSSWARSPGRSPEEVGAWWTWIRGWSSRTVANGSVWPALMLVIVAAVLPLAYRSRRDRAERRERAGAAAMILVPSIAALVVWFLAAPDVRFAYGWIWLVAIGLVAWLLPGSPGRGLRALGAVAAAMVLAVGMADAYRNNTEGLGFNASGDGPFGSASSPPAPETRTFVTASGLRLLVPVNGDQCWRVLWCATWPNPGIELRGNDKWDGFSAAGR
jgi:hypothetical protein